MELKIKCIKRYDPYYGFKIIEPGQEFTVRFDGVAFWSLDNSFGYLIGCEYDNHFVIV